MAARLGRKLEGEVLFGAFERGRYSTDASIYQVEPVGVVVPRSIEDVLRAMEIAREEGVPVLPRGGGTSQCGQTVNTALVIDHSRHLNRILRLDVENRRVRVEPGLTLDQLNRQLKQHGLWFPVDISTGNRATIGGMAGNNSCGARSIRYGNMVHNVSAIEAILPDGTRAEFGPVPGNLDSVRGSVSNGRYIDLVQRMRALALREAAEIERRFPKLLRRVGGYNIDTINAAGHNMAQLLVGSEGTLAFFSEIELPLQPIPPHRALGICHFQSFNNAMGATQHIVKLGPSAVELMDRTMIELAGESPAFADSIARFVRGRPDAILLVEFSGEDRDRQLAGLRQLVELMGDLGFPGAVIEATDAAFQQEIWEVRKAALNIVMSMKGDGKPVSFVEDCAVPLEHLAEYTDRLTQIFAKHGTRGTWYAHASVGTLHVRPILNLKQEKDVRAMRAIAEEAFALVREYKGSHSGEHGDGIVRSEFLEPMMGPRIVAAFEEVKDSFDPEGLMNPGRIVRPPRMDERGLFRYGPGYRALPHRPALDWSDWGGFLPAVEMCNNNGACRKAEPGVMCPSYRVTGEERHVTRGRANSLRLALTGQLGADALASEEMREALDLCVSCKGCKRECPTGVDMARIKIEFLAHWAERRGLSRRQKMVAYLPHYAPWAARLAPLLNLRNRNSALAKLGERALGLSARRKLPEWRWDAFRAEGECDGGAVEGGREVVLFSDTFTTWFEPENARAALKVLRKGGYTVRTACRAGERPLCCGRTFLSAGLVDEARSEARRTAEALAPFVLRNVPVVGLEPSCLLTMRDEFTYLLPNEEAGLLARAALLLEEFLVREARADRLRLPLRSGGQRQALLHGHCHQKAFGVMPDAEAALRLVPDLTVEAIASSCCGMAGPFGYEAEHVDLSMKMGELSLFPAVRRSEPGAVVVATGTSCRHQIHDGTGRRAVHLARVLEAALP
ncbi:MAG TPA: FAD-linked oxidase C-terminal domain-containing protein [Alphaproteobacteria bacterium]|nr:FAD-linked oxidase C-terminal domain-containing protein [Alphaproteobacteria bacterium]